VRCSTSWWIEIDYYAIIERHKPHFLEVLTAMEFARPDAFLDMLQEDMITFGLNMALKLDISSDDHCGKCSDCFP
jgi:hypothetical protein